MKCQSRFCNPNFWDTAHGVKRVLNRGVPAPDRPPTTRDSLAVIGIETGVLISLIEKTIQCEIIDMLFISIWRY